MHVRIHVMKINSVNLYEYVNDVELYLYINLYRSCVLGIVLVEGGMYSMTTNRNKHAFKHFLPLQKGGYILAYFWLKEVCNQ